MKAEIEALIAKWRKRFLRLDKSPLTRPRAYAISECADELAGVIQALPPEPQKQDAKHKFEDRPGTFRDSRCVTCGLERNYHWHTNPNYPGAAPEPEPEKAPRWPDDYGEHNFIGEVCVACGIPFTGNAGYVVGGRCPRNPKPSAKSGTADTASLAIREPLEPDEDADCVPDSRWHRFRDGQSMCICGETEFEPAESAALRAQIAQLEAEIQEYLDDAGVISVTLPGKTLEDWAERLKALSGSPVALQPEGQK